MHEFVLLEILATGLSLALVFGFLATRLRLSPIVGYLLAGFLIGPYSPGFVADEKLAFELSEAGVILLMFGVGLHFDLKDLLAVKRVAIPGAILQTSAAAVCGTAAALAFGFNLPSGLILGLSLAVASTVVLMRMLESRGTLDTVHGHVAVGWLVFEDIITVLLLVLLPSLASVFGDVLAAPADSSLVQEAAQALDALAPPAAAAASASGHALTALKAMGLALLRMGALWVLIIPVGGRIIPWCLAQVARSRSNELFTLSVMVLAFAIAVGAAVFFDTSVALGAFLAGMVVGKTKSSHRAATDLLPLRDIFAVLFFLSVGMLFNPGFMLENPGLIVACVIIVLVVKPITAMLTVVCFGYSVRTAMTVGMGLAQIGEFSFILASQAQQYRLIGQDVYNVLVVCALVSIAVNQAMYILGDRLELLLRRHERLWNFLHRRIRENIRAGAPQPAQGADAIVAGYGPTGRDVANTLRNNNISTVVIDLNMDTVNELARQGRKAVYGDASQRGILMAAGIDKARYLLLTLPVLSAVSATAAMALSINPDIKIIARARFLHDVDFLHNVGVQVVAVEEQQIACVMSELTLRELREEPEKTPLAEQPH